MPRPQLKFPNWEECLSGLIEEYRHDISLPESIFEDAHKLIKQVNRQKGQYTFKKFEDQRRQDKVMIPAELKQHVGEMDDLAHNQFYTLSQLGLDILWVDERVEQALGIDVNSFNTKNLLDWNTSKVIFHPMDALHVLRYAMLKDYICQLDGILPAALNYSFSLLFRMIQRHGEEFQVKENLRIERRREHIYHKSNGHEDMKFYLNRWTVFYNAQRQKTVDPSIEVEGDPKRTQFLNSLLFLFNAKYLGFSPKDIVVSNYNNLYDGPEESRTSLNRALRNYHNDQHQFEVKPFTDCSYYLNKKLTTALEKHSLEKSYKSSFYVRMNRLSKAARLGITPVPRELREIILGKVYLS